jgi:hypothetical protein
MSADNINSNPQEYITQQISAIKIQSMFRRVAMARIMRKLSVILKATSIASVENGSVVTIQNRWRRSLNQRRNESLRIISERIILENNAATTIVSESLTIQTALCFVFMLLYNIPCSSCTHIASALTSAIVLPWLPRLCQICRSVICRHPNPSLCEKIYLLASNDEAFCHVKGRKYCESGKWKRSNHTKSMETKPESEAN